MLHSTLRVQLICRRDAEEILKTYHVTLQCHAKHFVSRFIHRRSTDGGEKSDLYNAFFKDIRSTQVIDVESTGGKAQIASSILLQLPRLR